jgi:hypothetical protein
MPKVVRAGPEHAAGMTACMRRAGDDGPFLPLLHAPERLARAIEERELLAVVALAEPEVIGLAVLEPSPQGPIAESGGLVVPPAMRRPGIADGLRERLIVIAREAGLRGYYDEVLAPPGIGGRSGELAEQRIAERAAIVPCGLTLGSRPDGFGGRQSFVRYYRSLARDTAPRHCHLPLHHRALAAEVFVRCGRPRTFIDDGEASGRGELVTRYDPQWASWMLSIPAVGADSAAALDAAIDTLQGHPDGAGAYLELPLAQPGVAALCLRAEARGFFFSSLTPHAFADSDGLRLQWLAVPINPAHLALLNPFARRIAEHVAREQRRVGHAAVVRASG